MPEFRGENIFILRPNDTYLPFGFKFEPCSAEDVNDGSIPFNTDIVDAVIAAYKDDGTDVTATMITGSPTIVENRVSTRVNWPGAVGRYYLSILVTLDDGADKEFYFTRFVARTV